MSTITLTGNTVDVPTNINTLERLLFHNILAYQATTAGKTFNLDNGVNSETLYITLNMGPVKPNSNKIMVQAIVWLEIDPDIYTNALNKRPWWYALETTNNNYPEEFRAQ